MTAPLTLRDRVDQAVFDAIHARSLVYNTCWEDPAVDRLALDLKSVARCAKARGVDSCTAIIEHNDGRMELIEWGLERPALPVAITGSTEGTGDPRPERALAAREPGYGGDGGPSPDFLPMLARWRAFTGARPRGPARRTLP